MPSHFWHIISVLANVILALQAARVRRQEEERDANGTNGINGKVLIF